MKILIAFASRHGSTREIAEVLADVLRESGHAVDLRVAGDFDVGEYDAVVVGSAVYMGRWLSGARAFVERNRAHLSQVPVWLFSSGPVGRENPLPKDDPVEVASLLRQTGARGHRTFAVKLDKHKLSLAERLVVGIVRAPEGDFRDWSAVRDWAREIAAALATPSTTSTQSAPRKQ